MKTKYADCCRPLICLPVGDDHNCTLMEQWEVKVGSHQFNLPKGVKTDGASIPRLLWRVCGHPLQTPRAYAATVHDWLYSGGVRGVTRAEADKVYYLLLRHFGVSWWRAKVEYYALRLCGWTHWVGAFAMAFSAAVCVATPGCRLFGLPDKTVAIDGYFARVSEAGATLGTGKITTIPRDAAYLHAEYNEDTAFFSPSTKTRSWSFTVTGGTNWVPPEAFTTIELLKKYRQARENAESGTDSEIRIPHSESGNSL